MIRIALALCLCAAPAVAQPACGPREHVVAALAAEYGETPRSMGLRSNGELVETYASEATGTWTILATGPDGVSCLIAAGRFFEAAAAVVVGEPL